MTLKCFVEPSLTLWTVEFFYNLIDTKVLQFQVGGLISDVTTLDLEIPLLDKFLNFVASTDTPPRLKFKHNYHFGSWVVRILNCLH